MRTTLKRLAQKSLNLTHGKLSLFGEMAQRATAGKPPLVAMFNFTPEHRARDSEACGLDAADTTLFDMRYFAAANGHYSFPHMPQAVGSIYVPMPDRLFDTLIIGSSIRLFDNAWSRALLAQAARAVKPGGKLVVWYSMAANPKGLFSQKALEAYFGTPASEHGSHHLVFTITTPPPSPPSVLQWYYGWFHQCLLGEVNARISGVENFALLDAPALTTFLCNPDSAYLSTTKTADYEKRGDRSASGKSLDTEINDAVGRYGYYVGGISYKSALMAGIIRHYCNRSQPLDYCDMGGGYGLLSAELLLTLDLNIARATNADISSYNLLHSAQMMLGLSSHLRDRLRFWLGPSEEFAFDGEYDVISFVGSMLYSPRAAVPAMLQRAWKSLKTGGILIVHENIKAPSYITDYEVMFTAAELDALLEPLGDIACWSSQLHEPVARNAVGNRTVFRVVQKRG